MFIEGFITGATVAALVGAFLGWLYFRDGEGRR